MPDEPSLLRLDLDTGDEGSPPPDDPPSLWRLDLDTGHGRWCPQSEVADHEVAHLSRVLYRTRNTGRPARLMKENNDRWPYSVRLLREGEGFAAFSILTSDTDGEALETCVVYWTLDGAAAALAFATLCRALPGPDITQDRIGMVHASLQQGAGETRRTPALIVWFEPAFTTADIGILSWIGDAERCIAWTLVEESKVG